MINQIKHLIRLKTQVKLPSDILFLSHRQKTRALSTGEITCQEELIDEMIGVIREF